VRRRALQGALYTASRLGGLTCRPMWPPSSEVMLCTFST
jgi:hypothetical protein